MRNRKMRRAAAAAARAATPATAQATAPAAASPSTSASSPTQPGTIDVDSILAKVQVPPQFKPIYDRAVLSGMRIMFDAKSHQMMEQQLAKPGALDDKISEGIVVLIYMLWTKSNKTLPPQIIVPLTFALTLKAFDFLQKSGDPEATKEVLGSAVEKAMTGVMSKFGVSPDQMPQIIAQMKGSVAGAPAPTAAPAAPPAATGMLAQGGS